MVKGVPGVLVLAPPVEVPLSNTTAYANYQGKEVDSASPRRKEWARTEVRVVAGPAREVERPRFWQHRQTMMNCRCSCRKSTRGNRLRRQQKGRRWDDCRVTCRVVLLEEVAIPAAVGVTRVMQIKVAAKQVSDWVSDLPPAEVAVARTIWRRLEWISRPIVVVGPRRRSVRGRC